MVLEPPLFKCAKEVVAFVADAPVAAMFFPSLFAKVSLNGSIGKALVALGTALALAELDTPTMSPYGFGC